ncbi:DUF3179 domain-containing protein [Candidatus Woesearchaeota archaeon]|nr:DUF3179 domain-containing protein [Candidatus Woesearchaeota archaeon]
MFNYITSELNLLIYSLDKINLTGGRRMNWKILAGVLLVFGLIVGFTGSKVSTMGQLNELTGKLTDLSAQVKSAESLKNQLAETKAQLEKLNVNELYGMIKIDGKAKAYKIGDMNKMPPVIANDVIGNTPVIVSWCPLCGTLTAYDRRVNGRTLNFKVEGARKIPGTEIENLHLRDEQTNSVWAQGPGLAVEGSEKGTELKSYPVQLFNQEVITKMGVEVWKS